MQVYYIPSKDYVVSSGDFDNTRKDNDTSNSSTSYTITGLTPATTYVVYLTAFTGAGEGNSSVNVTNFTISDRKF